jgi:menaquinol-cytochrome c reductase iron-sulfur subunit
MKQNEEDERGSPLSPERRRFLARVCAGGTVACAGAIVVPSLGFVLSPLVRKTPEIWRRVGKLADFKVGETTNVTLVDATPLPWAGVTANTAAWLRRTGDLEFVAFSVNCTHLGCPVRWIAGANIFMCPCHGGAYYQDGSVAAGPPPHALWRYPARVQDDEVQVRADPIPIG